MTKLKVEGMTCGHCKAAVQEALEGVEGSQNISVDLDAGMATIEGSASPEALIAAVIEEGYQASLNG